MIEQPHAIVDRLRYMNRENLTLHHLFSPLIYTPFILFIMVDSIGMNFRASFYLQKRQEDRIKIGLLHVMSDRLLMLK